MTMKVGIVVVYIVDENYEKLLDIHLERIERHTGVPYMIYAGVNRLAHKYRELLAARSDVRLCEYPPTDQRGSEEHSYYLERLVKTAIDDGVTHILTLHVDSFPVRDRWVEELLSRLSDSCVFVSFEGINTACLFFGREFRVELRPTFLLTELEKKAEEYGAYVEEVNPRGHSGIGYGFRAWSKGLTWASLDESTTDESANGGALWGDLVFHLRGAVRLASLPQSETPRLVRLLGRDRFERVLEVARSLVPERLRAWLRSILRKQLETAIDDSRVKWDGERMMAERAQLLADPDRYISSLRDTNRS